MNKKTLPYLFLAAGVLLRVVGLTASSFWYDESFSVFLTRVPTRMVALEYLDFNPPLWQLIIFPFVRILGETELAIRLPALLASLGAMWVAWILAKELLPDYAQIPSSALIALLPYHAWMAQDGRCYALMSLLYVVAIYFGIKQRWVGATGAIGLLVWSHSTGAFYAAAAIVGTGLLTRNWRNAIMSGAGGLTFIAWLPSLLNGNPGHWPNILTVSGIITSLYEAFWANSFPNIYVTLVAVIVLVITIAAAVAVVGFGQIDLRQRALTIWAIGPLVLLLVAASYRNLIFYRPLSAMLLPFCVWVSTTLWPQKFHWWKMILPVSWGALLIVGLITWTPTMKGGDLRQVAELINTAWQPGDVVYHATGNTYMPFALYLDHPGYVLDEDQHAGLLQTRIQNELNIPRKPLEIIPHQRAWIIYTNDSLVSNQARIRMAGYLVNGQLVGRVEYWQAADIDIWLVDN